MAEDGRDEGDKGRLPPTSGVVTSSLASVSSLGKPLQRRPTVDHLGLPLSTSNKQKFKYARTYTIMYDQEKERDLKEEKQWVLLKDTKKVMDMSMGGLARLFALFQQVARGAEQSMIGPRTFSGVLRQNGIRDPVHIDRLFKNFGEEPDKIDYREFMRTLCSVNEEPVEDRLHLLFDVWDVDNSGSLSYSELGQIMVNGVPTNELDKVTETFNRVWSEIRSQSHESEENWIGPGRAAGISREDLVETARRPGFVRDFFIQLLTRQAPAAREHELNFAARLRELEAEILKDARRVEKEEMEARQAQAAAAAAQYRDSKQRSLRASKSSSSVKLGAPRQLSKYKLQASERVAARQITPTDGAPRLPPI